MRQCGSEPVVKKPSVGTMWPRTLRTLLVALLALAISAPVSGRDDDPSPSNECLLFDDIAKDCPYAEEACAWWVGTALARASAIVSSSRCLFLPALGYDLRLMQVSRFMRATRSACRSPWGPFQG